jgi:hypothetical protein
MYKIRPYSYMKAEQLNVFIIPSDKPRYKIQVFDREGKFLYYIGDSRYDSYPEFLEKYGSEFAERRRELYHLRHWKDANVPNSRGFYASQILW